MSDFGNQLDACVPAKLEQLKLPGCAVGLIENSQLVDTRCYGFAEVASGRELTESTLFQIASISKPVAAWGIMKLVEQGLLDLDAPVEDYLTRWRFPESEYDSRAVTARLLLMHFAGTSLSGCGGTPYDSHWYTAEDTLFGRTPPLDARQEAYAHKWEMDPSQYGQPVHLMHAPGSKFEYSGGGFTILELLIEELSGRDFTAFMNESVLNPLGMLESGFELGESQRGQHGRSLQRPVGGDAPVPHQRQGRGGNVLQHRGAGEIRLCRDAGSRGRGPGPGSAHAGIRGRNAAPGPLRGDRYGHGFLHRARTLRGRPRRHQGGATYRGQSRLAIRLHHRAGGKARLRLPDQQRRGQRFVDGPDHAVGGNLRRVTIQVLVLETGGTINGILSPDESPPRRSRVVDWLRQHSAALDITVQQEILCMKDSRAIDEEDRARLVAAIESSHCQHILIPHGTFTLAESGAYLCRHLTERRLQKTILLVGSLIPLGETNSDAPGALQYALAAMTDAPPGVWVAMSGRLWQPGEVMKDPDTGEFVAASSGSH